MPENVGALLLWKATGGHISFRHARARQESFLVIDHCRRWSFRHRSAFLSKAPLPRLRDASRIPIESRCDAALGLMRSTHRKLFSPSSARRLCRRVIIYITGEHALTFPVVQVFMISEACMNSCHLWIVFCKCICRCCYTTNTLYTIASRRLMGENTLLHLSIV